MYAVCSPSLSLAPRDTTDCIPTCTDGKLTHRCCHRSDRSQPTQYVDATGAPIKLTPGGTWVEFVPDSPDYPVNVTPAPPSPPASAPPTTRR